MSSSHTRSIPPAWLRSPNMTTRRLLRQDRAVVVTIVVLVIGTLGVARLPIIHGHVIAPALDLVLDTIAALVSTSVAVLAWVRFRERREPIALLQSAAFLPLAVAYVTGIIVTITRDGAGGSHLVTADEQLYVFSVARMMTAGLLIAAAVPAIAARAVRRPVTVIVIPAVALLALAWLLYSGAGAMLPAIIRPATDDPSQLPVATLTGTGLQLLLAILLLGSAWSVRAAQQLRTPSVADRYVVIGLVLAAFAELQWAIYPSAHPAQVSSADLLRLGCFLTLLLGIEAEARSMLRQLRQANQQLERLREADVERAQLAERTRLARELHDGLAQDLWLAKLKLGRLAAVQGLPLEAGAVVGEMGAAIESGLAEARQAVMALRLTPTDSNDLCELLGRYIEDFEERFGLRVDFNCHGSSEGLPTRTQAEVLRIAQESLVNARQHADATVVRVSLAIGVRVVELTIRDNGCGFDVSAVRDNSFGLLSMRERTALIGGELEIMSTPGAGTRVTLTVPVAVPATQPQAATT